MGQREMGRNYGVYMCVSRCGLPVRMVANELIMATTCKWPKKCPDCPQEGRVTGRSTNGSRGVFAGPSSAPTYDEGEDDGSYMVGRKRGGRGVGGGGSGSVMQQHDDIDDGDDKVLLRSHRSTTSQQRVSQDKNKW